jgi:hypothetical protein
MEIDNDTEAREREQEREGGREATAVHTSKAVGDCCWALSIAPTLLVIDADIFNVNSKRCKETKVRKV